MFSVLHGDMGHVNGDDIWPVVPMVCLGGFTDIVHQHPVLLCRALGRK